MSITVTVTDPALLAALMTADNNVELQHPDGRYLGQVFTSGMGLPKPGMKSPFTEGQLTEMRKQRTGRPLADILRDLQARG